MKKIKIGKTIITIGTAIAILVNSHILVSAEVGHILDPQNEEDNKILQEFVIETTERPLVYSDWIETKMTSKKVLEDIETNTFKRSFTGNRSYFPDEKNEYNEFELLYEYDEFTREAKHQYMLGDIVLIPQAKGNETSYGTGDNGIEWNNTYMVIVGIREDREFPYACALLTDDPKYQDIMAWFKEEDIMQVVGNYRKMINARIVENEIGVSYYILPSGYVLSGNKGIKDCQGNLVNGMDEETIKLEYNMN